MFAIPSALEEKELKYTYYINDPTGNVMGVYDQEFEIIGSDLHLKTYLKEYQIYGSSRLGTKKQNLLVENLTGYNYESPSNLRVKSNKAFMNFNRDVRVDFVYNPENNRMLMYTKDNVVGHTYLKQLSGAKGDNFVAGRLRWEGNTLNASEWTGYYSKNWNNQRLSDEYFKFMKDELRGAANFNFKKGAVQP